MADQRERIVAANALACFAQARPSALPQRVIIETAEPRFDIALRHLADRIGNQGGIAGLHRARRDEAIPQYAGGFRQHQAAEQFRAPFRHAKGDIAAARMAKQINRPKPKRCNEGRDIRNMFFNGKPRRALGVIRPVMAQAWCKNMKAGGREG